MRPRAGGMWAAMLCAAALAALAVAPAAASAYRPLLSEAFLETTFCKHCGAGGGNSLVPPPEGQLEDPCGLAVDPGSASIYVADYYHRAVDAFSSQGAYISGSQIALPGGPISGLGNNELDGVCGLAIDSAGNLYANEWHQAVVRLRPTEFTLDSGESTGVAVDAAGDVFVDDRTYIAKYAAPVEAGDPPQTTIGLGTLGEGYGLAVSADGARIYVADAASNTVKVYEPAVSATAPQATISHGFSSLVDSALAIDATLEPALPEHLLVLDNLQPGYEHPVAAVDEFEAPGAGHPGSYAFVGQVKGPAGAPIVHGEPSGLAVDAAGDLFVTDGNGELGNAFEFGPDPPGGPEPAAAPTAIQVVPPGPGSGTSAPSGQAAAPGSSPTAAPRLRQRRASASDVIQRGHVRVAVGAAIAPRRLPRNSAAPIHFSLSAKIASTDGSVPPQLRRISVEINRHGHLDPTGLPVCRFSDIQPSTTTGALAACRDSLIGEGRFKARVLIPQQAPFPSSGKIVAFNGRWQGVPAILAHVYGRAPVPISYTLPFTIGAVHRGTYGTVLIASLPQFTSKWGYVTGISLDLGRSFHSGGVRHSYLTAACPAPPGLSTTVFSLSRAKLAFAGRPPITQTLTDDCTAR
ncbi:MAG TPA: NHL repeat-containing protein [Solirubrobacterales bacterium]|nr:NHL repeat-containing protein [Solirubrobacterales bacterium]